MSSKALYHVDYHSGWHTLVGVGDGTIWMGLPYLRGQA